MSEHDLAALAQRLAAELGVPEVEAYHKRGRSRRLSVSVEGRTVQTSSEEGWAIRAGGESGSGFWCGSGPPPRELGPSRALTSRGGPLALPLPGTGGGSAASVESVVMEAGGTPLASERTLVRFSQELEEELRAELPGATVTAMVVDAGASRSRLASTHGLEAGWRRRAVVVRLQGRRGSDWAVLETGARRLGDLEARSLARRLADRLVARRGGATTDVSRRTAVLSPLVGCRLLEGLSPLWCGAGAAEHARALAVPAGRLAAEALHVADDGSLPEGLVSSTVDGEGVPTGRRILVEAGRYVAPLVSWREDPEAPGCVRRPSWRTPPALAASHLFIRPGETPATELLASVESGHYLLAPVGDGVFDVGRDQFALPVCGFVLDGGAATAPLGEAVLGGSIGELLRGIEAVGRDLEFAPRRAIYGAPTLLVFGVTLQ